MHYAELRRRAGGEKVGLCDLANSPISATSAGKFIAYFYFLSSNAQVILEKGKGNGNLYG